MLRYLRFGRKVAGRRSTVGALRRAPTVNGAGDGDEHERDLLSLARSGRAVEGSWQD
jgi:hypothetical protein